MSLNPFNQPLRWMFGQLFGSKAKAVFDKEIAPQIDTMVSSEHFNPASLLTNLMQEEVFSRFLDHIMAQAKIPASYRPFVKDFLTAALEGYVTTAFKAK